VRAARAARVALILASVAASACAPGRIELPSGDGEPFPAFAEAARDATTVCRAVRTITAELGISGRAGGQKLRGRATVGIAAAGGIRLEGTAPFGPPVFILAAVDDRATLFLPRDNRVVSSTSPAAILGALVGLDLGAGDLLATLSGCVVPDPLPVGGRLYVGGWVRIDLAGDGALFLRRDARDRWRVQAGLRPALRIDYERDQAGVVAAVRISARGGQQEATDLRIAVAQVELDGALGAEVFRVTVPADARPMTLEELRRAGPMGDRR
jgi:hypothetical protein